MFRNIGFTDGILTAAHRTGYVVQNNLLPAYVSFDPLSINGTTPFLPATVYHNPGYNSSMSDSQDVAAMVLCNADHKHSAGAATDGKSIRHDRSAQRRVCRGRIRRQLPHHRAAAATTGITTAPAAMPASPIATFTMWIHLSQNDLQAMAEPVTARLGRTELHRSGNVIAGHHGQRRQRVVRPMTSIVWTSPTPATSCRSLWPCPSPAKACSDGGNTALAVFPMN